MKEEKTKTNEFLSCSLEPITLYDAVFHEKKMCSKFLLMKSDIFCIKPNLPNKKILSKHSREAECVFKNISR